MLKQVKRVRRTLLISLLVGLSLVRLVWTTLRGLLRCSRDSSAAAAAAAASAAPEWDFVVKTKLCSEEELGVLQRFLEEQGIAFEIAQISAAVGSGIPHQPHHSHHPHGKREMVKVRAGFEALLKAAERRGMKRKTQTGSGAEVEVFSLETRHEFENIDEPDKFFTSGERMTLLKDIMTTQWPAGVEQIVEEMIPLHNQKFVSSILHNWIWSISALGSPPPLDEIRGYFGEEIAFYFAFLSLYTKWLLIPGIFGLFLHYYETDTGLSNPTIIYSIMISLWATNFLEAWKRQEFELAFRWDVHDHEEIEEDRADFRAVADYIYSEPLNSYVYVYPWYKHMARILVSFLLCTALIVIAAVSMLAFLALGDYAEHHWTGGEWEQFPWNYANNFPMIMYSLVITFFSSLNQTLAVFTSTQIEIRRTETELRNAIILKLVALQFNNFYMPLLYTAFVQQDIELLRSCLGTLLVVQQITGQFMEVGEPIVQGIIKNVTDAAQEAVASAEDSSDSDSDSDSDGGDEGDKKENGSNTNNNHENHEHDDDDDDDDEHKQEDDHAFFESSTGEEVAVSEPLGILEKLREESRSVQQNVSSVSSELNLAEYTETFNDYLEVWVQFGQATLFATVFPIAALFAYLNNVVEIRTDAFKILRASRRGFPVTVSGIGSWHDAFDFIGYMAVMTNIALIWLISTQKNAHNEDGMNPSQRLMGFVVLEHVIVAIKVLISVTIPDIPEDISSIIHFRKKQQEARDKQEFEFRAQMRTNLLASAPAIGEGKNAYFLAKWVFEQHQARLTLEEEVKRLRAIVKSGPGYNQVRKSSLSQFAVIMHIALLVFCVALVLTGILGNETQFSKTPRVGRLTTLLETIRFLIFSLLEALRSLVMEFF